MRIARPALALAATASVLCGISAQAAAKPVCNLGVDAADDANGTPIINVVGAGPSDPAYDITSFDVASDAKTVTTVVRVKGLSEKASLSPTGVQWNLQFDVAGQTYQALVHVANGAKSAELDTVDNTTNSYEKVADAVFVLDTAKNEVRVSFPASLVGKPKVGSGKFSNIQAVAGRYYEVPLVVSATDATDVATTDRTYTAGAKSCVKPGK